jgi:hypothetical protein
VLVQTRFPPKNGKFATVANLGSSEEMESKRSLLTSRFAQLYALANDPNEDAAECAAADLFHEFNYLIQTS